jgi:hypothetical protein
MLAYTKVKSLQELLTCCEPDPNTPETPGGTDCCYDNWNADLQSVTANWQKATAIASKKEKAYNHATEWYGKLKIWVDDWEQTDTLADAITRQLELFIKHLNKVCVILDKTSKSLEILFCMIRDLYTRVDWLKRQYDELYTCINSLKRPELDPGTPLRACLDEYGKKLDAVIATRDDLITQVVTVLELSFELHDNICDEYGLKSVLVYWKRIFTDTDYGQDSRARHANSPDPECSCCELKPEISFPIDKSSYYNDLRKHYEEAKTDVAKLKKELAQANERKTALQACKDGLTNALQAVDPAARCK